MLCMISFSWTVATEIFVIMKMLYIDVMWNCRYWGIISMTIAYVWQLYTIWLLVILHESVPPGIRYSRFMHLSVTAFG